MSGNFFSAVIVAAGNSSRMGGKESKIFIDLCGKAVILRTAEVFDRSGKIDEIIIVCKDEDRSRIADLLRTINKPVKFARGGDTRQKSVLSGIKEADERCTYLVIHDGARPLVTQSEVERVIKDAEKFGAATLSTKVKDTIKISKDGFIESTPERAFLYAVQTPQVFLKSLYLEAAAKYENESFTDDCRLIEEYGGKVCLSPGEYTNIKITTLDDIVSAKAILEGREGL